MQHYQLEIVTQNRPETIERVLRVIRHRGFEIINLMLKSQENEIIFNLEIKSERVIDLLKNQLIKLIDVKKLS